VRDMAPLISHDAEVRAAQLFNAWKDDVDKLEKGDETAEAQVSEAIVELRKRILLELRALN